MLCHEIRQTRLKTFPFVCQELGKNNTSYHYLSFCSILSVSSVYFDSHNTIMDIAVLCTILFFLFKCKAAYDGGLFRKESNVMERVCSLSIPNSLQLKINFPKLLFQLYRKMYNEYRKQLANRNRKKRVKQSLFHSLLFKFILFLLKKIKKKKILKKNAQHFI